MRSVEVDESPGSGGDLEHLTERRKLAEGVSDPGSSGAVRDRGGVVVVLVQQAGQPSVERLGVGSIEIDLLGEQLAVPPIAGTDAHVTDHSKRRTTTEIRLRDARPDGY